MPRRKKTNVPDIFQRLGQASTEAFGAYYRGVSNLAGKVQKAGEGLKLPSLPKRGRRK